jgi:ribonuclease HI
MQQRLDRFFTFKSEPDKTAFNPFGDEVAGSVQLKPKKVINVVNILDAPTGASPMGAPVGASQVSLVIPTATIQDSMFVRKEKEDKPLFPETDFVEMIQPRTKDGKRLLYKHPKLPRVGPKGSYQLLVGESDRSEAAYLIQFDGAANPNPGPASAGAVLWSPKDLDGKRTPIFESGKFLGKATNNIAEVQGLLLGLQIAATRGARELLIEGDSELIIFQQTGRYKVSDKNLKNWWANIQAAMMDETSFDWIAIKQVPREQNERADSITKEVLSRKSSFHRA